MKKCPMCAEEIQDEAIKCKHCGEIISKHESKQTMTIIANMCTKCKRTYDNTWKVCMDCNIPLEIRNIEQHTDSNVLSGINPKMISTSLLMPGEKVYIEARPNALSISGGWIIVLFIGIIIMPGSISAGVVITLISIIGVIVQIMSWKSIVYAITNKRIITSSGILSKECKQCPLTKIQNFEYKKYPLSSRGYIYFDTAGGPGKELTWKYIDNVEAIYHKISAIIHR